MKISAVISAICLFAFTGHALAANDRAKSRKRAPVYGHVVKAPAVAQRPEFSSLWGKTTPANPIVKDCVHVAFPQCGGN
jgi:hypothetical protein